MMEAEMPASVPVRSLFETHLTVGDLGRAVAFGLWSLGSAPMGLSLHVAFDVALDDVLVACERLRSQGVTPLSFFGVETTEASVIGWMPAAAVYFRDPDGNLLEYLAMLGEEPRPELGIVPWSEWTS
jgi:lactoylglutathione lyase